MNLKISDLQLEGKNIVIVEDDISSVKYYEALLRNSGANVRILNTGKQFIDLLNDEKPVIDLVFIDFLIPIINGVECIIFFRKIRKTTPVVMITAYSSEQVKTEAYIAGCNEYVLKPIYCEKLIFLIDKYLIHEVPVALRF